jgi:hypothetical protein
MRGKFAIFETPDGGLHIAYRLIDPETGMESGEDKHLALPASMVKMANMAANGTGPMAGMLGKLVG